MGKDWKTDLRVLAIALQKILAFHQLMAFSSVSLPSLSQDDSVDLNLQGFYEEKASKNIRYLLNATL